MISLALPSVMSTSAVTLTTRRRSVRLIAEGPRGGVDRGGGGERHLGAVGGADAQLLESAEELARRSLG